MAALYSVTLALIYSLAAAEKGAVGNECHDQQIGHGTCGVLILYQGKVLCLVDHHSFAPFVTSCTFDYVLAKIAYKGLHKSVGRLYLRLNAGFHKILQTVRVCVMPSFYYGAQAEQQQRALLRWLLRHLRGRLSNFPFLPMVCP